MSSPLDRVSDEDREKAAEISMPDWMNLMLAKLPHDHFSDPDWIYERKLDGERVYAGRVGTGYDDETLASLHSNMARIERNTSPCDLGDMPEKEADFITPKLVCEVKFTEWTSGDKLRHAAYMGLRRGKDAENVHKKVNAQAVGS